MKADELREFVEGIQSTYDENWCRSNHRIPGRPATERIRCFLKQHHLPKTILQTLLPSLCEIDLERDWMYWRSRLRLIWQSADVASILAEFADNAVCSDYLSLISELVAGEYQFEHLEYVEYQSRCRWGDSPKNKNGTSPTPDLSVACRKGTIHASQGNLRWFQVNLHGITEFGRQRSNESMEWGAVDEDSRVVIASKQSFSVSREHFTIQLLSPDFAIVTNVSNTMPLLGSNGLQFNGGIAKIVPFPFGLTLPGVRIWCE